MAKTAACRAGDSLGQASITWARLGSRGKLCVPICVPASASCSGCNVPASVRALPPEPFCKSFKAKWNCSDRARIWSKCDQICDHFGYCGRIRHYCAGTLPTLARRPAYLSMSENIGEPHAREIPDVSPSSSSSSSSSSCSASVAVITASIYDGQFVINYTTCNEPVTLTLYLYDDSTDTSAFLYSVDEDANSSGTVTVQLDDVGLTPRSGHFKSIVPLVG
jgi:hypothetical protein